MTLCEEVEDTHSGAQGVQECRVAEVLVTGCRLAEALLQEKFSEEVEKQAKLDRRQRLT